MNGKGFVVDVVLELQRSAAEAAVILIFDDGLVLFPFAEIISLSVHGALPQVVVRHSSEEANGS